MVSKLQDVLRSSPRDNQAFVWIYGKFKSVPFGTDFLRNISEKQNPELLKSSGFCLC